MRLRSRPYLHYAPVPGGVYVSGPRAQFVLRGPAALLTVVDACVPLLESGTTEDDLVAALGTEHARPSVRMVVDALRRQGLLLPLDALTVAEPPESVRARYAEHLAHLEARSDDPYAAFARLRASSVLLRGPHEVVLPAARALARAGAGRLVLACDDTEVVRGVAQRVGAALLSPYGAAVAAVLDEADLAVWCVAGETPLPASRVPLVPVRLGAEVHVVGPVTSSRQDEAAGAAGAALARRARAWVAAEGGEPVARPSGDAMAGALAAQEAFDALTDGGAGDGAYVVSGAELEVERVDVARPHGVRGPTGEPDLEELAPAPAPDPAAAVAAAERVTARWVGRFAPATPPELLQLPIALRVLAGRDGGEGSVGWGWDQPAAALSAVLAGLRQARQEGGAAGLTEERWLLDGALRALAEDAEAPQPLTGGDRSARTVQVLQALAATGGGPVAVEVLRVTGLDWWLGRVVTAGRAALAWAPGRAEAAESAACVALARRQVLHTVGRDLVGPGPDTDALVTAGDEVVARLRRQVEQLARAGGFRCRGRSAGPDAVLGDLPLHWGGVLVLPRVRELAHA